jgi:N-methylhydantoinase A
MSYQIAVDIGGTFTDLYLLDEDGERQGFKASTTPDNPINGVKNVIEKAASDKDMATDELLSETEQFVHGTTISTNAIIEGDTAKTALLTTDGFRDTLRLREGGKGSPYEHHIDFPKPYIPRALTYGIEERINAEGGVETELNETQVRNAIEEVRDSDVEAVAVALLWSHVNPEHEQRIGEMLDEMAPDLSYSLSHNVNPIIREYRRTSATAIDASIIDLVKDYLSTLEAELTDLGFDGIPLIVTANGGIMEPDEVARTPIWTVDSGPTMFPVASGNIVEHEIKRNNVIGLDMGGTSLDMGIVQDGKIPRTREEKVGNDYMLGIEKVRVESIGSGGGSIAWVDDGGLLHVGPESAGADPGPVCYKRGGTEPTFTDAALALDYLNEDYFLGGNMEIDRHAAMDALEDKVGDKLGLDPTEAAHAIYATAIQDMVNGIEEVTLERGIDPRNFVLSGGGGALGMVIVQLARELQIDEILLPGAAGVVSSMGGLASDLRRDFSASNFTVGSRFDHEGVNETLTDLKAEAKDFFERVGISEGERELNFYTEARYPEQVWELEFEIPFQQIEQGDEQELMEQFQQTHEQTYGFRADEDVEFLYWRVEAVGETSGQPVQQADKTGTPLADAKHGERDAYFDGHVKLSEAYRADLLEPGHEIDGPAFVEDENTTVVLPPEAHLTVTDFGNYHIIP